MIAFLIIRFGLDSITLFNDNANVRKQEMFRFAYEQVSNCDVVMNRHAAWDMSCNCTDSRFAGKTCEAMKLCLDNNPCLNLAYCKYSSALDDFKCHCLVGTFGRYCEENFNECDSIPCMNNATCLDGLDYFNCTCMPGYRGHLCEELIKFCNLQPCENGGKCVNLVNNYTCVCDRLYGGRNCGHIPCTSPEHEQITPQLARHYAAKPGFILKQIELSDTHLYFLYYQKSSLMVNFTYVVEQIPLSITELFHERKSSTMFSLSTLILHMAYSFFYNSSLYFITERQGYYLWTEPNLGNHLQPFLISSCCPSHNYTDE